MTDKTGYARGAAGGRTSIAGYAGTGLIKVKARKFENTIF
jgi:hypothetical protein